MTKGEAELLKGQQLLNYLFARVLVDQRVIEPSEMQQRLVELHDELQKTGEEFAASKFVSPLLASLQRRYGTEIPQHID